MEHAIRFGGVGQQGHSFYRFFYWGNDFEVDHILQGFLYLFMVFYGHFPAGMLNWSTEGSVCMV